MSEPLTELIAALEKRVHRLEERDHVPTTGASAGDFWVLDGLKERAPSGGVVFAGAVTMPAGEYYEWQYGLPSETFMSADWGELASDLSTVIAALGHPVRLLVLGLVLTGTQSVAELREHDALGTTGQLYHHIRLLISAGWLNSTSRGHYAVPPDRIVPLLVILTAARR